MYRGNKILGLIVISLTLVFSACTKKPPAPDTSANISPASYAVGNEEDAQPILLEGPFVVIEKVEKRDDEGKIVKDPDTGQPVLEDKAKTIDTLPVLNLQVGDEIPKLTDTKLGDIPHKETPEDADAAKKAEIKAENDAIDVKNKERKQLVFVGWFSDEKGEKPINFDEKVSKATKVVGVFKKASPNKTLVSFRTEAGVAPSFFEVDSTTGKIEQPANIVSKKSPRIIINNWVKPSGDNYEFDKTLAENGGASALPISATWEKVLPENVVVNWISNLGQQNLPFQMKKGDAFPRGQTGTESKIPTNPIAEDKDDQVRASVAENKVFLNWTTNLATGDKFNFKTNVDKDLDLYAYWDEKKINISFQNNIVDPSVTVKKRIFYGATINKSNIENYADLTAKTASNKNFKHWTYTEFGVKKIFELGKTKLYDPNLAITAVYHDKATVDITAVEANSVAGEPTKKLSGPFIFTDPATGETKEESNLPKVQLEIGTLPKLPATPSIKSTSSDSGYVFAGWYADKEGTTPFDFDKKVDENTKQVAIWKRPDSGNVIVSFITDSGKAPAYQELNKTDKLAPLPNLVSKKDDNKRRAFLGWHKKDGTKFDFTKTIAENGGATQMPLKAKWQELSENQVMVNFVNSIVPSLQNLPVILTKGSKLTAPKSPTVKDTNGLATLADEKLFTMWRVSALSNVPFDFDSKINEDTTLYSTWGSAYFNVRFENDKAGTSELIEKVKYNELVSSIGTPNTPSTTNEATFRYWVVKGSSPEVKFDVSTDKVHQTLTLVPKWRETYYKFVFVPGNLEANTALRITDNKLSGFPVVSTWSETISGTKLSKVKTDNGLLIPSYSGIPTDPQYKGYTWAGWINTNDSNKAISFDDATFVQNLVVESIDTANAAKVVKTIKLTGTWNKVEADRYSIIFNMNGKAGNKTKDYAQNTAPGADIPEDPTNVHYTFAGWYEDASLTSEFNFSTTRVQNQEVFAKWVGKTYKVTFTSGVSSYNSLVSFGFDNASFEKDVVYPNKVAEPKVKAPMPAHKMRWSQDSCTSEYNFDDGEIGENITLKLCDLGFDKAEIVKQMVEVKKAAGNNSNSPAYDYYVFPYETTNEMHSGAASTSADKFKPKAGIPSSGVTNYVSSLNNDIGAIKIGDTTYEFVVAVWKEHKWAALAGGSTNQKYSGESVADGANMSDFVVYNVGASSPVFPSRKANAFGLYDMSGNLAELTRNHPKALGGDYKTNAAGLGDWGAGLLEPDNLPSQAALAPNILGTESTMGFRLYLVPKGVSR